jgi:hypothetical protein
MPIWDKALLFHDTEASIERWLVVPLTADESPGSLKCSKCNSDTDVAAVYSIPGQMRTVRLAPDEVFRGVDRIVRIEEREATLPKPSIAAAR